MVCLQSKHFDVVYIMYATFISTANYQKYNKTNAQYFMIRCIRWALDRNGYHVLLVCSNRVVCCSYVLV